MYGSVAFSMHITEDPFEVDLPQPVEPNSATGRKKKDDFSKLQVCITDTVIQLSILYCE